MTRCLYFAILALLLALEVAVLVLVGGTALMFPYVLWQTSPFRAVLAVLGFAAVAAALWRSHRRESGVQPEHLPVNPQISLSRIPMSGAAGAIYMLQFVVWALCAPAVGLFYAALIAGALLLLPLVFYLNRPGRRPWAAGMASVLGMLCGLWVASVASAREFPRARLLEVAVAGGVLAAPALVWLRSRRRHVSIAPYAD